MPGRRAGLLKEYKRLRAIEDALSERMFKKVTKSAVHAAAKRFGMRERGQTLFDHDDFGMCLEFATYHHRVRGKTVIERMFDESMPDSGTDEHTVLTAMMNARFTLLALGEPLLGVGVEANDLLFGKELFLADIRLSKLKETEEMVIATHLLEFDDFAMTPCTSYLDFDPELAQVLADGLPKESKVPMGKRFGSPEAKADLTSDLMDMAVCSVDSVMAALRERFDHE